MVRQAREMIRNGDLGELIAVRVLQAGLDAWYGY